MIKLLPKFLNLGINGGTDPESAKRIRLGNTLSILGISVGIIVLIYAYLSNWPLNVLLILSLIVVGTFIPPLLNYFQKIIASRISFLFVANISIICLCIVLGKFFHFQYFLSATLCLPLIFFGNELGRKKIWLSGTTFLFFIYLEWHFIKFESLIPVDKSHSDIIRFVNDFFIFLMIFLYFYFFAKENDKHVKDIKAKSAKLEEKNIQLQRNLEETQELQARNKGLKHFANIASHDLSEPLRTVDSFVEIIHEEYADTSDENISTYFSFIHEALNRMRNMIDGLLRYSKIGKSGNFKLTHVNQLVHEIELDLKELIHEKKAVITKSDLPAIVCLPLETRQLFQNLISNAIKFQPPESNPIINITYNTIPEYWQFCVADNGIGISPI